GFDPGQRGSYKESDHRKLLGLLRPPRNRPPRRAAEQRDELPPSHLEHGASSWASSQGDEGVGSPPTLPPITIAHHGYEGDRCTAGFQFGLYRFRGQTRSFGDVDSMSELPLRDGVIGRQLVDS